MHIEYHKDNTFSITNISMYEYKALMEMMKLGSVASQYRFSNGACNILDDKVIDLGRKLTEQIKEVLPG